MKNSIAKFGIVSLAAITLSAVMPVVATATFSNSVVYAEEQKARTLNIMDRPTDVNGTYLPDVGLGLSQVVNVTPEKPYVVNQPEIKGWERSGVFYIGEDSSQYKTLNNGDQITYNDLSEGDDGSYGGLLLYSYKKSQPTTPVQPDTPAEKPSDKPAEPSKPDAPATKPETPAEKPSDKPAEPSKPDAPATKPETPAEKPSDKPAEPSNQTGTAATNAPKADTKAPAAAAPKADKPAEKKMEALPNTGETNNSIFLALGALLAFVITKLFSFRKKS